MGVTTAIPARPLSGARSGLGRVIGASFVTLFLLLIGAAFAVAAAAAAVVTVIVALASAVIGAAPGRTANARRGWSVEAAVQR